MLVQVNERMARRSALGACDITSSPDLLTERFDRSYDVKVTVVGVREAEAHPVAMSSHAG
jgi:hypothetical protein